MIKGFFNKNELEFSPKKQLELQGDSLCSTCGLYKSCKSPKMEPTGEGRKGALIIAEAAGAKEDELGVQLVGDAGEVLRNVLKNHGLDLDRDFWKTNSLACRPPNNRNPKNEEIKCCRPRLEKTIKETNPTSIWLMGNYAIESFYLGRNLDNLKISSLRGRVIPDVSGCWIFPIFHPSFVLRNKKDTILRRIFETDIRRAIAYLDVPRPNIINLNDHTRILMDYNQVVNLLKKAINSEIVTHDFETSGLLPYRPGHKIYLVSLAIHGEDCGYAFPLHYPHWSESEEKEITRLFKEYLEKDSVLKIAHNVKFEHKWAKNILGVETKGWYWDTMLGAHILDARNAALTGLKTIAFLDFGIEGYENEIKPYMETDKLGFNKLYQFPLAKLGQYGASDSYLTDKIFLRQRKIIERNDDLSDIFELFMEGTLSFADAEDVGICVNEKYYEGEHQRLTAEMKKIEEEIINSEEAKKFKSVTGKDFRLRGGGSSQDLKTLLFKVLNIDPVKKTTKDNPSVDEEALSKMDYFITKKIVALRKLDKLRDTYLKGFTDEVIEGKIHPNYNLHIPASGRSCIAKGTKILLAQDFVEYPCGKPIEEIKKNDLIYCFDDDLEPQISKVIWARKTGYREIIRIHFYINGSEKKDCLDVTPEHLIRLISGKYIQAQNLVGDLRTEEEKKIKKKIPKIRTLSGERNGENILFTGYSKDGKGFLEHRFIYEKLVGSLTDKDVIHHINGNHLDHRLENLEKTTLSKHSKYHAKDTLLLPETRKRNKETIEKAKKAGVYKERAKRWPDTPNSIQLSKFGFLKILAKNKGLISRKQYDFSTFKSFFKRYNIDQYIVRLRYDKNGNYISKRRLQELAKLGRSKVQVILGHNYCKLLKLYDHYGIDSSRRYSNQYGPCKRNNHVITRIERLNQKIDVYDIEVEKYHNFIANGICVHNSSDRPNFQQIPKRDEEAKKCIRTGIIPLPGYYIIGADYKQIEVRIQACYSKDKELIRYIKDPKTDMHRDQAEEIFILPQNLINKELRYLGKNGFVFPQFYGDWYVACAKNIWEELPGKMAGNISVLQHLANKGIRSLEDFTIHMEGVEKRFWKKLNDTAKWKEEEVKRFQENLYTKSFLGFRRNGYLKKNQIVNTPIQGTAFHCLLWSFIQLNALFRLYSTLKEKGFKSVLCSQIHDEILMNVWPTELNDVVEIVRKIMCEDIREKYPWIIVPLEVEFILYKDNWYKGEEIKIV